MERIFRVGALILCVVSWPLVSYAFSSRPLSLPTQAHLHSTLKAEPIRVSVAECCPPVAAGNCRGVNSAFRRHLVRSSAASLTSLVAMATYCPQPAHSIPFLGAGGADKRQIEIILIAVLRTRYWIESVARRIELMLQYAPQEGPSDSQKEPYLEARLDGWISEESPAPPKKKLSCCTCRLNFSCYHATPYASSPQGIASKCN